MEKIKLKGNTNRGIHYLSPVTPIKEHPDEEIQVYDKQIQKLNEAFLKL